MEELLTMTDDQLVRSYIEGNNEAFDVIIERHKNRLYSYIYHSVRNADLANDIFQETFVKAIVTINQGRYCDNGKFAAWITRIAHNLIIDFFRQEKSENLQSCDIEEIDVLNRKELSEDTIEDELVISQIHNDIRRIIKALPQNQQEVLVMRYYKNMSFKEIAQATNVSINTALGRMRYAILNMRRIAEANNIVLTTI